MLSAVCVPGIPLRAGDTDAKAVAQKHEPAPAPPEPGTRKQRIPASHPLPDASRKSEGGRRKEGRGRGGKTKGPHSPVPGGDSEAGPTPQRPSRRGPPVLPSIPEAPSTSCPFEAPEKLFLF